MIELVWYIALALACLVAITNWRYGLLLAIAADGLRDPVRKLIEDEPVGVTLSGALLWIVVTGVAVVKEQNEFRLLFRRYATLRTMLQCLLIAIVPAAILSCFLYQGGYKLAVIGVLSYSFPLVGIGAGYLLATSEKEIYRVFTTYCVVNGLLLIGTPLEFFGFDIGGLGGMKNTEWIRYGEGFTVDLISGFYRSPDVMGLHAAHVVMFSVMMAVKGGTFARYGWTGVVIWASIALMVCGRRKMIGIPLIFVACFLALGTIRGVRKLNSLVGLMGATMLVGLAVTLSVLDETDASEYAEYASSTFTEGAGRANKLVVGSTIETLRQVGLLGNGIGTATQGRHYVSVQTGRASRGWQEDGVSRVFIEFGVPGAILLVVALFSFGRGIWQSIELVPPASSVQLLQIGVISVLVANGASFVISHQQFSGDPTSALWATMMAGLALGAPRIAAMKQRRITPLEQRAEVGREQPVTVS